MKFGDDFIAQEQRGRAANLYGAIQALKIDLDRAESLDLKKMIKREIAAKTKERRAILGI